MILQSKQRNVLSPPPRLTGWLRMNPFQLAMFRWSTLHPYNVVFVTEWDDRPELSVVAQATREVLADLGVADVEIDERKRAYRFSANPEPIVDVHAVDPLESSLESWLTAELNRPFARAGRGIHPLPLRVRLRSGPGGHFVAFAFDHWIGDGIALTDLMGRILRRSLGRNDIHEPRLDVLSWRWKRDLPGWFTWRRKLDRVVASVGRLRALRSCHGPSHGNRFDLTAAVRVANVPEGLPDAMRRFARSQGATVNDVLLAAVLEACDRVLEPRFLERRRRDLAIACITSLRSLDEKTLGGKFGHFLGYFHAVAKGRLSENFGNIVQLMREQTSEVKRRRTDLCGHLDLAYCNLTWPWMSQRERLRQVLNNNPVAAGLSNMRTSSSFTPDMFPPIRRILTAVSPGVTTPLAVHATTTHGQMEMTFNYRTSVYRETQIDQIVDSVQARISAMT